MRKLISLLAGLNKAWGCPGDGCDGIFRTREQAEDHGRIARVVARTRPGTAHDTGPQRRARRSRGQALRQLRQQR